MFTAYLSMTLCFPKKSKICDKIEFPNCWKFFGTPRNSRLPMFFKIGVPKTFAKFTGKHLYWNLFLIRLLVSAFNFVKKRLCHRCFPVNFMKFLGTPPVAASEWWAIWWHKPVTHACKFTTSKFCSLKFYTIHKKTPVLESLFNSKSN